MLIQDYRDRFERMPAVRILATDISAGSIEKGRKGGISAEGNGGPSGPLKEKVLYGGDSHTFQVDEKLKYNIRFQEA